MKRRRRWVRRRNHQRIAAHPRRMKRRKGRAATLSGAGGPQGLGVSRVSSGPSQRNQRPGKSKQRAYVHRRWYFRTAAKYFLQDC